MGKKIMVGIILVLLSSMMFMFSIETAKAEARTWTVDDDGPADFSLIQEAINAASPGDTIFVHNGTYEEKLTINKSKLILSGESKNTTIIDGSEAYYVVEIIACNASVAGFTIQNGYRGFESRGRGGAGIYMGESSTGNTISDNTVKKNANGILLNYTIGNNISNNMIMNNDDKNEINRIFVGGIKILNSSYNHLTSNYITKNRNGIMIDQDASNNIVDDNVIEDNIWNGIYFAQRTSSGHACTYNNVTSNKITSNGLGLALGRNSAFSNIINNTIASNTYGLRIRGSSYSFLRSNAMFNNTYNLDLRGFPSVPESYIHDIDTSNTVNTKPIHYLLGQNNLVIEPSTFPEIGYLGIARGNNVTVRDLALTDNGQGILLHNVSNSIIENVSTFHNECGILMQASINNTAKECTITNNINGIWLSSSHNNTISCNTISNNGEVRPVPMLYYWSEHEEGRSINLSGDNNTIYHNNFINNAGSISISGQGNSWDDGYPSGGNYWSNYNGTDFYSGPDQNETGNDGMGDTPYTVNENNRDTYPLMEPFLYHEHDIAVSLRTPYHYLLYGTSSILEVAVHNLGLSDENNVSLEILVNEKIVNSTVIPQLISASSYKLNYTWIPTIGDRYFNVTAYAKPTIDGKVTANNVASASIVVYHLHDIAIANVTPSEEWVPWEVGQALDINVTIKNKGTAVENINVTVARFCEVFEVVIENTTNVGTQIIYNLPPGAETSLSFSLNTTGMLMGVDYTIHIDAWSKDLIYPFRESWLVASDNSYHFQLMIMPYRRVFNITCEGQTFNITAISHTPLSNFNFSQQEIQIGFDLADPQPYPAAYCAIMVPSDLIVGTPWTIPMDGTPTNFTQVENETHTILSFNYANACHIIIKGTWVIPEFPSFFILPLFMIATLLAVIAYRRKTEVKTTNTMISFLALSAKHK